MQPPKKDTTPVWFELPYGSKRVFPRHAVAKMLADKNRGWKECEPEFVSKTKVRPTDDGKTHAAVKNANTEMTGRHISEFLEQSFDEVKEFAQEKGVSIQGLRSKKSLLEKLEEAKVLFK